MSASPPAMTRPETTVRVTRERWMGRRFVADPRASRPRPRQPFPGPAASLAGVPDALRGRIGRGLQSTAFPYVRYLESDGRYVEQELEVITLENTRWTVVLAPSLGGRILRVFDRTRQRDLLLQPPMLNLAVIGLPGAWFVGGIEFNAFRYGHNIHGLSAIGAEQVQLADGTVAVRVGACDELFGTEWSVTVALGATQVLLRVELENWSDTPQPDYWWTTIAVPAQRHTRILASPGPVLHHGMFRTGYQHDTWPALHAAGGGRADWSRWLEHHEILSAYWYQHDSDVFGYADTAGDFAFVHRADRDVCRGRKLWSIGAGRDNAVWSDRLLEPGSASYLELQSGLYPTQVECGSLQPGERRSWTESIGAVELSGAGGDEEYGALFSRYEQAADAALRDEYSRFRDAAAWRQTASRVLAVAGARVELSRRIVRAPDGVSDAEVRAMCEEGWVAGPQWLRRLETMESAGRLERWSELALAALRLDSGDAGRALPSLQRLAAGADATAGWAALFIGDEPNAVERLERAAELLPERADVWIALDRALSVAGRHEERAELWRRAPGTLLEQDVVRVARAAGELARGEWREAREQLTAPMPTIPEGSLAPWLIYRETYVAEAVACLRARQPVDAAIALLHGGEPAPQFGVGRDEAGWAGDLFYYRWRLAKRAGRELEASLLVGQVLELDPYPGSVGAAYLARLVIEAGHGDAQRWRDRVLAWDRDAGPDAQSFSPLRSVVMGHLLNEGSARWDSLRRDPLYSHRVELEEQLSADVEDL